MRPRPDLNGVELHPAMMTWMEDAETEIADLRKPMPCGHSVAAVHYGDEGTNYCRWCEDVAELAALRAQLEAAGKKLRRWQTDWTHLCAAIVMSPITVCCRHHRDSPKQINIDDVRQRLISEYYRLQSERETAFAALAALDAGKETT